VIVVGVRWYMRLDVVGGEGAVQDLDNGAQGCVVVSFLPTDAPARPQDQKQLNSSRSIFGVEADGWRPRSALNTSMGPARQGPPGVVVAGR
jgi:hypothetical protein